MNKEEYIALYNNPKMYDQWEIGPRHVRSRFMLAHIQGPKVIELGCGGSGFLRLIANDYECSAVDINPKWIDLGRKRLPQVNYTHSMIEDFTTDERFDSVILMEVLEHVIDPVAILAKARSLLNEDGAVLISTPKKGGPWDHVDNHVRQYTLDTLIEDVSAAGFTEDVSQIWEEGQYLYAVLGR